MLRSRVLRRRNHIACRDIFRHDHGKVALDGRAFGEFSELCSAFAQRKQRVMVKLRGIKSYIAVSIRGDAGVSLAERSPRCPVGCGVRAAAGMQERQR